MRALILLASACGFHGPVTEVGHGDAAAIDGPESLQDGAVDGPRPGVDGTPPIIDAPQTSADAKSAFACNSSDVTQMLCLAFENNTVDGSISNAPVDVTGNGLTYTTGEDGLAVSLDLSDSLSIPSSAANLVTTQTNGLTIKAYVNPASLPINPNRMGIVDNDAYRMFIMPGGAIRCALVNGAVGGHADLTTTGSGIPVGAWTRVTCSYDGAHMTIYFNGVQKNQQTIVGTIPVVTTSTQIGGNQGAATDKLVGLLDDLQLFKTALVAP